MPVRRLPLALAAVLIASSLAGCGDASQAPGPKPQDRVGGGRSQAPSPKPQARAGGGAGPTVLFLGDSLTAGYGLAEEQAFPARIDELLAERGVAARVVNAGVSGDTSAGGLSRLDWLLRQQPDVVVVALGANDGLRGLAVEQTEANLRRIIAGSRQAGAEVLLAGMRLPPNYGADYVRRFEALFPRLADELEVPLIPFLLEGVAADPELNLADGIHPNAEGQRRVARHVLPYLLELLDAEPVR